MGKQRISFEKNKLVIFSSDTFHHRYFINQISSMGFQIDYIFFETKNATADFKVGPLFEEKEDKFEKDNFFKSTSFDIKCKKKIHIGNINDIKVLEKIKEIKPSIGIVFGTGKIKGSILDLFKGNLFNVHRGMPQRYRGLDSDLWAIYHNDYKSIGTTIHRVDNTLDSGDFVYQKNMQLKMGMKIHQIRYYTTLIASELSLLVLDNFYNDKLVLHKQQSIGRYYSFMPYDLKVKVEKKFNSYCKKIHV